MAFTITALDTFIQNYPNDAFNLDDENIIAAHERFDEYVDNNRQYIYELTNEQRTRVNDLSAYINEITSSGMEITAELKNEIKTEFENISPAFSEDGKNYRNSHKKYASTNIRFCKLILLRAQLAQKVLDGEITDEQVLPLFTQQALVIHAEYHDQIIEAQGMLNANAPVTD
jgi:hypothetical protein